MTRKLYYEDLYARDFDATITDIQENSEGKFEIILDQTLFFPSGGGQPCDLGFINDAQVLDVFERGENIVHVLAQKPASDSAQKIHGTLDWNRRFEFMQQHLGEHIFAGCLYNLHKLHTARMRIEGENVSLDLDIHADWDIMKESETLANEVIWKNIPVEILYPSMDEIKQFARKLPPEKSTQPIRIVKIPDVDYVPCCGVHVKSTGEVGVIKVTSIENHKGGTRVYLKCGVAAYKWLSEIHDEIRKIESELVCGDFNMLEKIQILKSQIRDAKSERENLLEHFLEPVAENLLKNSQTHHDIKIISHVMQNSSQDEIKHLFRLLTEDPSHVALLAGENSDGVFLTFGCNRENKRVDVRAAFKDAISKLNGKGGGSGFCAQGWGKAANISELEKVLDEAKTILENALQ